MEYLEIEKALREAKGRIETEATWCQGAAARTRDGCRTYAGSPLAVSWCASGRLLHALVKSIGRNLSDIPRRYLCMASGELYGIEDKVGYLQASLYDRLFRHRH